MTAKFLHQVQAEIDRGVHAAAAKDASIFGDELFGPPQDLRMALAQNFGHCPVRCRLPAVEEAAFREKRDPEQMPAM